jgi:hypothetical protein
MTHNTIFGKERMMKTKLDIAIELGKALDTLYTIALSINNELSQQEREKLNKVIDGLREIYFNACKDVVS